MVIWDSLNEMSELLDDPVIVVTAESLLVDVDGCLDPRDYYC